MVRYICTYVNIRGLRANLDELAVAGSDYDVLVYAESKVSDRRHLSESVLQALVAPTPADATDSTPGAQGMALYVMEGFRRKVSWNVLALNPVCLIFALG